MKLLTEELRRRLPALYAAEDDPIAQARFFAPWPHGPWASWRWYPAEFDGNDELHGLIVFEACDERSFSLAELEIIRGPGGLYLQRDVGFKPTPFSRLLPDSPVQQP